MRHDRGHGAPWGGGATDHLPASGVDVLIDFTNPAGMRQALELATRGIALVIGTTGLKQRTMPPSMPRAEVFPFAGA